ncbi:MAG: hypothetical protein MI864_15930 [Pseudomonadales bacterium]|nr:hypothetical protein [Pseudomonadales bacterium]
MTTQNNTIDKQRTGWCLSEIYSVLESINSKAIEIINAGDDVFEVADIAEDIKRLACSTGLMVETEAKRLDVDCPEKGYEGWIVPPSYREKQEA